jgi:catalase
MKKILVAMLIATMMPLAPGLAQDATNNMTTNQGHPIYDDENSQTVGERGPTLLQDFQFIEKIAHFDRERIPERVVHAKGAGAFGYFQVYEPMANYTKAKFLQDPSKKTPVFVRFSTVAGGRGSADTVRDVRGFATKFYTEEGNYDLVGNDLPVFFIRDAIKFPDLIHAVKAEPNNNIPSSSTGHNNFWDFISLTPESTHMLTWVFSDRGTPASYRMIEGFGVNTYKWVNSDGQAVYVKYH